MEQSAEDSFADCLLTLLLPLDDATDRDCCVELVVLGATSSFSIVRDSVGECCSALTGVQLGGGSSTSSSSAAATAAADCTTFTIHASSVLLKMFSQKFRDCFARWASADSGAAKKMILYCRDAEEVSTFQQLLSFIHSAGRNLPTDAEQTANLALLAREHGVEPCVAACLQQLHSQVATLPPTTCMLLLSALETGASEHSRIQGLADSLQVGSKERLCRALLDMRVCANAGVQAQLLHFLGPLQEVLNDQLRREVFVKLPFELLLDCIFEDGNVQADTEATVLAAFALWAERNIEPEGEDGEREGQVAAICSRIRFPAVPPSVLLSYHTQFHFMRRLDPEKELLLRAITSAVEPAQGIAWPPPEQQQVAGDRAGEDDPRRAKCERWWAPRSPPLQLAGSGGGGAAPCEVQLEVGPSHTVRTGGGHVAHSTMLYWNAYWWRVHLYEEPQGRLGVYAMPSVASHFCGFPDNGKPNTFLYKARAAYKVWLCSTEAVQGDVLACEGTEDFVPTRGYGWGESNVSDSSGAPLSWAELWEEGSRFMHNGAARVRIKLSTPCS